VSSGDRQGLERFAFRLALRVLARLGFGALTRPTMLRIGFRDICRDLDLHEGTSVRIVMETDRVTRAHLDYDANALLFRTATAQRDPILESALVACFPTGDVRHLRPVSPGASGGYQVRFPLPLSLEEVRVEMAALRAGFLDLFGRFEGDRRHTLDRLVQTFGRRETLSQIQVRSDGTTSLPLWEGERAGSVLDGSVGALTRSAEGGPFGSASLH
jgi:hypothetical protein